MKKILLFLFISVGFFDLQGDGPSPYDSTRQFIYQDKVYSEECSPAVMAQAIETQPIFCKSLAQAVIPESDAMKACRQIPLAVWGADCLDLFKKTNNVVVSQAIINKAG